MARPKAPVRMQAAQVSGNRVVNPFLAMPDFSKAPATLAGSASVYRPKQKIDPNSDRRTIAQPWQIEAYGHVNKCGEARYAATLFAAMAARAEIGISDPQGLAKTASWIDSGPEVQALALLAPTVRERTKLIRDYMLHYIIAGECYLIARPRVATDPDSDSPNPIWEIVAVTELRKFGEAWEVRHDNSVYLTLTDTDPVIRLWNPDPENRQEAWSPFRSMLPTLREIEWLTKHIFAQVKSRLMSAGVWFLPDNLTFPKPPSDAIEGGAEAIAELNEAEQFMLSLAASSMTELGADEPSFPSIVMADPIALAAIDQHKLIKFWSEIDDKAMILRSDAIRRFGLGMDLPTAQVIDPSAMSASSGGGSGQSVNHWGEWAKQEQAISTHVEPALDIFTGSLTAAFLRSVVKGTTKIIAYNTASLRLRQDLSKQAVELFDRGLLKGTTTVREVGFDPENDMMDPEEHKIWMLGQMVKGSWTPEQMAIGFQILTGISLPAPEAPVSGNPSAPRELPGPAQPRNLDEHPVQGPPEGDHDHKDAAYAVLVAASEGLVLRALEKAGNRLLNDGKRGRDKDRSTPPHLAHVIVASPTVPELDFSLLPMVLGDLPAADLFAVSRTLHRYCTDLYATGTPYSRDSLATALKGL